VRRVFLIVGAAMALTACQASQPASRAAAPGAAPVGPQAESCERIPTSPAGSAAVSPGSTLPSGPNLAGCGEALPPQGAGTLMPAPTGGVIEGTDVPTGPGVIRPLR